MLPWSRKLRHGIWNSDHLQMEIYKCVHAKPECLGGELYTYIGTSLVHLRPSITIHSNIFIATSPSADDFHRWTTFINRQCQRKGY